MLAAFFVHDDSGWRLKGHAREPFYRWLASWGMSLTQPSDLGYSNEGYELPPLCIEPLFIASDYAPPGQLLSYGLKGIGERSAVRQGTVELRVQGAVERIAAEPDEQWIAWVGLNEEGRQLARRLPDAVLVEGAQSPDEKADALEAFAEGRVRVLVTKPSIAGHGMNLQNCARMAFVGLGDSFEYYFQCLRRCWRFGQTRPVHAHIILTEPEEPVYRNVLRKETEAQALTAELIRHVRVFEQEEVRMIHSAKQEYQTDTEEGHGWKMLLGDSAERLKELPDECVDLSIFSPPFSSLYTYSATERDLGNSRTEAEFWEHFGFISRELLRVTKPGRLVCCHVAQIPSQLARDGVIGLKDFRGQTIEHFKAAGFIHHGEVCCDKDPQAQAIRTKAKALLFVQFRKDSSWSRPALADYILLFRAPGENAVPIQPDVTNNEWIEWARPVWYGIRETDTLNVTEARSEEDERHICPLQKETIRRCVRLWSNPGELICSPFAGIASEGVVALECKRRFWGCELKPEYWQVGCRNLKNAERERQQGTLLALMEDAEEEVTA
jgi:DNA modification methylase